MPLLLQIPEAQFIDANGAPYAGGTVTTYIPGTSTFKPTWADNLGAVQNANPLTLDAAGRCLLFGDGDYRLVLEDADGNLVYDQWTSSVVSDAMQPVVRAPTIADAQNLLGIMSETDIAAQIATETQRAQVAEATLQTNISNETTRAQNAEAELQTAINTLASGMPPTATGAGGVRAGVAITDGNSRINVTFNPAFTAPPVFTSITTTGNTPGLVTYNLVTLTASQWITGIGGDLGGGSFLPVGAGVAVEWYAIGY